MLTATNLLVILVILEAHPTAAPELVAAVRAEHARAQALEARAQQ